MSKQVTLQKDPVNRHYRERYIELELEHDPVDDDELFVKYDPDTNDLVIGYLTHDTDLQWDGWDLPSSTRSEIGDQGLLVEFRTAEERDRYLNELEEDGRTAYVVDKYAHGNVHYSLEGTMNYPDRRWDVAPCGVYVLDEYTSESLKKGEIDEDKAREIANSQLDTFSDFCNGAGYGCIVETFRKNEAGEWEQKSEDSCWNYIGENHATACLKEDQLSGYSDFAPLKKFENTNDLSF